MSRAFCMNAMRAGVAIYPCGVRITCVMGASFYYQFVDEIIDTSQPTPSPQPDSPSQPTPSPQPDSPSQPTLSPQPDEPSKFLFALICLFTGWNTHLLTYLSMSSQLNNPLLGTRR
jgi:hypothetical protein